MVSLEGVLDLRSWISEGVVDEELAFLSLAGFTSEPSDLWRGGERGELTDRQDASTDFRMSDLSAGRLRLPLAWEELNFLGPLALGSLIVAILETICALLRGIMRSAAEDGNGQFFFARFDVLISADLPLSSSPTVVACCLPYCVGCCVEWFTNLVEFFNK